MRTLHTPSCHRSFFSWIKALLTPRGALLLAAFGIIIGAFLVAFLPRSSANTSVKKDLPAISKQGAISGSVLPSSDPFSPIGIDMWTTNGPGNGVIISDLQIAPSNPNILYASSGTGTFSFHGVYKSIDSGGSWTRVNTGLPIEVLLSIAIDPVNPNIAYAGSNSSGSANSIYKTTNGGGSWTPSFNLAPISARDIEIDPTTPNTIYVCSDSQSANGVIFKTTNGGATWSSISTGLAQFPSGEYVPVSSLAINPINTNILYATSSIRQYGVYKSINGGGSWSALNTGIPPGGDNINSVEVDPIDPDTIYIGTNGVGAYKSINGGGNWNPINNGFLVPTVYRFAIDNANHNIIYAIALTNALGVRGLYKSTNGGGSWNLFTPTVPTEPRVIITNPAGQSLFVGTSQGVYDYQYPNTPLQEVKLLASDGAGGDNFGESVAISGDTAVVGAPFANIGADTNRGAAYVFARSSTGWQLQQKLTANDGAAFDNFGISVAIDGDTVVVGAFTDDVVGPGGNVVDQGSAYVFVRTNTTWSQQQKLTANDGVALDHFGLSVDISGDTVIAGAPHDIQPPTVSGAAYTFVRTNTTWSQQQKLTATTGQTGNFFGFSVAIEGNTSVIGARGEDIGGRQDQGATYIFTSSGNLWSQASRLFDSNGLAQDSFGWSVGISNNTVAIGSPGAGPVASQGAAYVFAGAGTTWNLQQKLSANDAAQGDQFGESVGISGNTVAVGAPRADIGAAVNRGAAYTFVRTNTTWSQQQKLTASDGAAGDVFGYVAVGGNTTIVGAPSADVAGVQDQGAAYVFGGSSTCTLAGTVTVPTTGTVGSAVPFAATVTPSGCSGTPTYDWDFGDSTPHSSSQNPMHTYTTAGTFTWTLTASLAGASPFVRTGTITISNVVPGAPVITEPANGEVAAIVTIRATGGTAPLTAEVRGTMPVTPPQTILMTGGVAMWDVSSIDVGNKFVITVTDASSRISAPVNVTVQPLVSGKLRVKDPTNPSLTRFFNLTGTTQGMVTFSLGANTIMLPVRTDGAFTSRDVPGAEAQFSSGANSYGAKAQIKYDDVITVDTTPGGLDPIGGCGPTILHRTASKAFGPFAITQGRAHTVNIDYPLPIFLHHGIEACYTSWTDWTKYLNDNGYVVFTPNHQFATAGGFALYAAQTKEQIYDDLNRVFATPSDIQFYFIAHSQGGVVSRLLSYDTAVSKQLRRTYTLGTPHSGTIAPGAAYYLLNEDFMMKKVNPLIPGFPNKDGKITKTTDAVLAIGGTTVSGTDGVVFPQDNVFQIRGNDKVTAFLFGPNIYQEFQRNEVSHGHIGIHGQGAIIDVLERYIIPNMKGLPTPAGIQAEQLPIASLKQSPKTVAAPTMTMAAAPIAYQTLSLSAGQTKDAVFPVSTTARASFLSGHGVSISVQLVSPGGSVITPANASSFPGVTYTNEVLGHRFDVTGPQQGNWTLRVTAGASSVVVETGATEQSVWQFDGTPDHSSFVASAPATFIARLLGDLSGVTLTAVTATVLSPAGTMLSTLDLFDDGNHFDLNASDSFFGNRSNAPTTAGAYKVIFQADGTVQGRVFRRQYLSSLDVLRTNRLFTGSFSSSARDANGDTVLDTIDETIGLNIPTAGQYTLAADLCDTNGNLLAHAVQTITPTAAGQQPIVLSFNIQGISCSSFTAGLRVKNLCITDSQSGITLLDVWTADVNVPALTGAQFGCLSTLDSDLSIVGSLSPSPVLRSGNLTYTVTVRNNGPNAASSVVVNNVLPAATFLTSCSATNGGVCGAANINAIAVTFLELAPGAAATITLTASISGNVNDNTLLSAASTVGAATTDTNASNNSVTATVRVQIVPPGSLAGPGTKAQGSGSVLIYPIFTSSASNPNAENTCISITNTNQQQSVAVHLFFVDGVSCSVADSFICLTANQTATFLAADLDPGTTGYLVAIAVDKDTGCPIPFNDLIGDEYVKLASGHASALTAEAIPALNLNGPLGCGTSPTTATTATLAFDGITYAPLARVLALDSIGSRADGNDTLLIVNRIGGNLGTGAATLGSLFGILYNDTENGYSFSVNSGGCQLRSSISSNFPRTAPRVEQIVPAGRTGWLKLWGGEIGLVGAAINRNTTNSGGAFNHGHNLHKLTFIDTVTITVPVFPPACR